MDHLGGVRVHSGGLQEGQDSSKQVFNLGGERVHSPKQVGNLGGLRVHSVRRLQEGPDFSKQIGQPGGLRVHSGVAANSCWIRATLKCFSSRFFALQIWLILWLFSKSEKV